MSKNYADDGSTIHQPSLNDIMVVFQDGELAAIDGRTVLSSPYIDSPQFLRIWMLGYMDRPIEDLQEDLVEDKRMT